MKDMKMLVNGRISATFGDKFMLEDNKTTSVRKIVEDALETPTGQRLSPEEVADLWVWVRKSLAPSKHAAKKFGRGAAVPEDVVRHNSGIPIQPDEDRSTPFQRALRTTRVTETHGSRRICHNRHKTW